MICLVTHRPSPVPKSLGGEEGLKDLLANVCGNADAVVSNDNAHAAQIFGGADGMESYAKRSSNVERIDGVGDQV